MKTGSRFAHILEQGSRENLSRLSFNEFKLATKRWDMTCHG